MYHLPTCTLPWNINNYLSPPLDQLWMFWVLVLVHSLACIVAFGTTCDGTNKFPYHSTPVTTTSLDHFWVLVPLVLVQASTCPIRQATSSHWTSKWSVASLLRSTRLLRCCILLRCYGFRRRILRWSILQSNFRHCNFDSFKCSRSSADDDSIWETIAKIRPEMDTR